MNRLLSSIVAVAIAFVPTFAMTATPSQDVDPMVRSVEVGSLTCKVLPNTRRNYLVRSTAQVDCVFSSLRGEKEMYRGVAGIQLGLDLTVRENEELAFAVFSSRKKGETRPPYALKGKYFGASATASFSYGIGAAALVGGSRKEISLQPLGISTLRGLGIGAGLGYLYLERGDTT